MEAQRRGRKSVKPRALKVAVVILVLVVASKNSITLLQQSVMPKKGIEISTHQRAIGYGRPLSELEDFLATNANTPAGRFVVLLRQYLYFERNAEAERIEACLQWKASTNSAMCFGGLKNYRKALALVDGKSADDKLAIEKATRLALYEDAESEPAMTVYDIYRYDDNKEIIPFLGTQAACLPLMLAGFAVSSQGMALELGPFAGFSTRCIAAGMAKNAVRQDSLVACDSFEGHANFKAITGRAPWLQSQYPSFTNENPNFVFLWEKAVQPVYPAARALVGWINKDSVSFDRLHNKPIDLLSVDSAKSGRQFYDQLEGISPLKQGSILFLMDFELVSEQIKQVYGCLREEYLLPVYVSFTMEHWAWIVRRDFSLQDSSIKQCFQTVAKNLESEIARIDERVVEDSEFLGSFGARNTTSDPYTSMRDHLKTSTINSLHTKPDTWLKLAGM